MPASFVVSSVIDIQQVYLLVITIMILSNEQPWISQWHIKLTLGFCGAAPSYRLYWIGSVGLSPSLHQQAKQGVFFS